MKTRENHKIIKGFRTILAAGVLAGSILAGGGVETASAGQLQLCAKLDRKTEAIRSGSPVKVRAECGRGELKLPGDLVIPGDMYIPGEMYIVTPEIMEFLKSLGARIQGIERLVGCDKDQLDCDGDTAIPGDMYKPGEALKPTQAHNEYARQMADLLLQVDLLEEPPVRRLVQNQARLLGLLQLFRVSSTDLGERS